LARQRQGNLSGGAEIGPTRGERNGSPSPSDTWFSTSVVCCPSRDRDELFAAVGCQGAAATPTTATTDDMDPFLRGGGGDEEDPKSVDLRMEEARNVATAEAAPSGEACVNGVAKVTPL
jgi:hypothetical protein